MTFNVLSRFSVTLSSNFQLFRHAINLKPITSRPTSHFVVDACPHRFTHDRDPILHASTFN